MSNSSSERKRGRRQNRLPRRISSKTSKKLVGLFLAVILALVGLAVRITSINATEGQQYKRIVMTQAQQQYDTRTIPAQRGDITDRNGTVLATSEKVYNVILDCKVVNSEVEDSEGNTSQAYLEPTVKALVSVLGMNEADIRDKLTADDTKNSQYVILEKNVSITKKKAFEDYCDTGSDENKNLTGEEAQERGNIKGVWFEEIYVRTYPMDSQACDLIGFTYDGTTADWGIEGYYSDILNGTSGREYGYYNMDADVEQTIIPSTQGRNVVSTIDINIQQIIRNAIENFNNEMATDKNKTNGAKNIGVIVMDPDTGEILGMDSNYWYDLNNPRDLSDYYTSSQQKSMTNDQMMDALNKMWGNFCISDAFEPGSVFKPLTMAAGLETAAFDTKAKFTCDGGEQVYDKYIQCEGIHGTQTLDEVMKNSCNDALMQMGEKIGVSDFSKYEDIFNLGSRTGIDLPGEEAGLIYTDETMGPVELACAAFGQGFTLTMIQEAAAISSVINGGYYYKPHVVKEITDSSGAVYQSINPILERRTVSEDVSADVRGAMAAVMEQGGTGYVAKIPGYSMGGKTGTAEKLPRGEGNYLLDFVGFAPLDDPQVLVYVVVDEPNTKSQETSVYAESIARNIFIQLLPYMNIFPDEEGYTQDNVTTVTCNNNDLLNHNYQSYDNGIEVNDYGQTYGTDSSTESSTAQAGTYDENGNYISNGQTHSVEQEITDQTVGENGISDTNLADTPQDTGTDQTQTDNSYYSDGITNEDAQYYQDTVYQDTAYNGG